MQEFIVALIVCFAIWLICKQYMPNTMRALRRRVLQHITKCLGLKKLAASLKEEALPSSSNDCCASCKSCGPTKKKSSCESVVVLHDSGKKTRSLPE